MKIIKCFVYIVMATSLLCNCSSNNKSSAEAEEEEEEVDVNDIVVTDKQMQTVDIKTGTIQQRNLAQQIRANGQLNLDAQSQAEVASLVGGIVRSISAHEGNEVRKGQVVAYIENTDIVEIQRNYISAVNELRSAKQDLERQKTLKAQGAGVEKNLQQAQTAYNAASAQVSGIAQQLSQLGVSVNAISSGRFTTTIPIKSPISGVVSNIKASIGSYVDMQSVLMTVVDNSKLHCDLRFFEKDIPYLKVGQEVDLYLTNDKGIHLTGKVYDINQSFDDDTKAVKVHVGITSRPSVTLMPAMYVTGVVSVGTHSVPALPDEAIISKDGKKYAFMLTKKDATESHFKMVEVTTGVSQGGYTEVTLPKDVATNATFITTNAFYIASMIEGEAEED